MKKAQLGFKTVSNGLFEKCHVSTRKMPIF